MKTANINVAILFSDFGPYHVARINALANALAIQYNTLFAIRFSAQSDTYSWKSEIPTGVEVITLAQKPPTSVTDAFSIAKTLQSALKEKQIEVIFLPSYSPLPNLLCFFFAKIAGYSAILMSESWHGTEKANFLGKVMKHAIVRLFDAAFVGGTPQKQYACAYGQKESKVFLGYDAVDVNYYAQESKRWQTIPTENLPIPNLPARYFLNLGRFVPKKNLSFLILAYAELVKRNPTLPVALVLVGEGNEENTLKRLAFANHLPVRFGYDLTAKAKIGPEVVFYPFQQVNKTPVFFTHCEAFILPSMYEEWGLVVNEAMACGAAVLVSENVGCVQDLVKNGENGFQFNPVNVNQLCNQLQQFVSDPGLAQRLGRNGSDIIRHWGTERFAEGALNAIRSLATHDKD